ncbi:hypothetical protein CROQUDRAFT_88018 [Cronartium quercuum f. sp. fusiforme G11]|uniref:Uncharacterized protein n=1 Tax=Cronartium quercuum f. sp. fusiforme G11 TaxID=708437 RepID=A0A9P6NUF6_9BASI|nr:hypothetical protein CROQUDRAFT_88018 [Cronartium quercuum f. sp. fusiforme G11]
MEASNQQYSTRAIGPAQDGQLPVTSHHQLTMAGGLSPKGHKDGPSRLIGARFGLLMAIQAYIKGSLGGPVKPKRLLASDHF